MIGSVVLSSLSSKGWHFRPDLGKVETEPKIIKVKQGGGGDFATVMKAIDSVPADSKNMPNLMFDATVKEYGIVGSATLTTLSNYFVGAYLTIANSAPKHDGKRAGAQAVALRVSGDRSAFYGCNKFSFQDTLCDDRGNHFFKDCYIRGTVDFILEVGNLYIWLDSEIFVEIDPKLTVITAQARESSSEDIGYSFVHGKITGTANGSFLVRAWKSSPRVVYVYTKMTNVVNPAGWSHEIQPERAKTVYHGEYKWTGVGAYSSGREPFAKQLTQKEAEPFLSLDYVNATKWLLPAPKI
ncbi:Pectinesterase isoform 2 [Hibiscus syriacus]|uniref:pectinesterase n=1 Tax=Hibiscus syriacus TaxID=106335 RepID=A0A6A3AFY5_HIBSY|nr:Pectinesterase isoform 2 [Hibiscus syriacus]